MEEMNIVPKIKGDLDDQDNLFFNFRDFIKEYLEIDTRLEKEDYADEKEKKYFKKSWII